MTKAERELRNQIEQLKTEARNLVAENKMVEARSKADEAKALTDKANLLAELEAEEVLPEPTSKPKDTLEVAYRNAFFKAFRRQQLGEEEREAVNAMTATDPEDGGLLVPEDVQTKINEFKRVLPRLEALVETVPVNTASGSRVFEKLAAMVPLENITDDTADIAEMVNPQFQPLTYAIKKYAGWMPVPNDLLKDSDQNIIAYLMKWIGKKSVVTRNSLILAILQAGAATAFGSDYKKIKKALNVTLDPMIAANAVIVTNQDGFQFLDTLEDGTGKPILQVDITKPTQRLFAGKVVHVVANSALATTGTSTKLAPIFVGDIAEGIVMFERQGHEIASTNIGGTAFRKDRTELRVIEREDVVARDTGAFIYGTLDVTTVLAP
ncbi:MAG TPA: phage major capsid protein [Clostridia bacterium]|nr:phage major capsid protein [Clostridia bacterium]